MKNTYKMILVVIAVLSIQGCLNIQAGKFYSHVRAKAIPPVVTFENNIVIGKVLSQDKKVPQEVLEISLKETLDGNDFYSSESGNYTLNVTLESASVSVGLSNTAAIEGVYVLTNTTGSTVLKKRILSEATLSHKLNWGQIVGDSIINTLMPTPYYLHDPSQVITKEVQVKQYGEKDYALGLPQQGTFIDSSNGEMRMEYAIEAALRKNYVEFLLFLNRSTDGIDIK